jgi:hypothetical protein
VNCYIQKDGFNITTNNSCATGGSSSPSNISMTSTAANAAEGGAQGSYTLTRTGATAAVNVTVALSGSATVAQDYTLQINGSNVSVSGSSFVVPFAANQTSVIVNLLPVDDSAVEGSETAIASITASPLYNTVSPSSATITIADNDSTPPVLPLMQLIASDRTAYELTVSDTGSFTISRTLNLSSPLTVKLSVGGTSRTQDYTLKDGSTVLSGANPSIQFAANQASKVLTVTAVPNNIYTGTEWVKISLVADAAYAISSTQNKGTVAIVDKDGCAPNIDHSTQAPLLNANDYMAFMNAYAAGSSEADINGDGDLNVADFTAFGNAYAVGCVAPLQSGSSPSSSFSARLAKKR